jgi:DNA-binding transcriptional MerR regulator
MQDQLAEPGFSGTKAAKIVGISYRQLDYWARTDLVRPSLTDAKGSGSRRAYSYRDLLELRVIKSLLDAGIKLESVRIAFEYLRKHVGHRHRIGAPRDQRQRRRPLRRGLISSTSCGAADRECSTCSPSEP